MCVWETCGRRYIHDWHKGHTARFCNSCRSGQWRDRRELKWRMVQYKGGACILCGYRNCLRALDFHHFDPSQKRFSFGPNHQRSWKVLRAELDKCMLLCSNCHFELEADKGGGGRRKPDDPDADSLCRRCGKRFKFRHRRSRNYCMSCSSARWSAEARHELKAWMVTSKGDCCQVCGFARHQAALTFHHVDPALKRFNIVGAHGYSRELLQSELDRCVLLCANCHDELEDGAIALPDELVAPILKATAHLPRLQRRASGRPHPSVNARESFLC